MLMKKLTILIILIYGCAVDRPISSNNISNFNNDYLKIPINVNSFGSDLSLDIITWNIEKFPKNGNTTIDAVSQIIQNLNVDIVALQEIEGYAEFNNMLESLECSELQLDSLGDCNEFLGWGFTLNGCQEIIGCSNDNSSTNFFSNFNECYNVCNAEWEGYRSNSASYDINLAYIYNASTIIIHTIYEIFIDDWSSFPRSPLVLEFSYKNEDFIIINNHLKCCDYDYPEEKNRRESALNKLQQYIIDEFYNKKVIIIGDMNDSITDNESSNVFTNFLNDSLFYFADIDIAFGSSSNWSYPTYPSHIDHIIISNEIFDIFNSSDLTTVQTLKIDNELNGGWTEYDLNISDHRPVGIRLEINN